MSPTPHPLLQPRWRAALAVLAIGGAVLPWIFNLRWFAAGGSIAPGVFWPAAMANDLATAMTLDVYMAALAFSAAVAADRPAGRARWWAIPLCFGVSLACALPGYLAWRSWRCAASAQRSPSA